MNGYSKIINGVAVKQLQTQPSIPDFSLAVGSAETLSPIDLKIQKQYTGQQGNVKAVSGSIGVKSSIYGQGLPSNNY